MSVNYSEGLSPYEHKGKCGMPETYDPPDVVQKKIEELTSWIIESNHFVVHTGAGISTSAGIPDFRGPKGVWTLEQKGLKPEVNVTFDNAVPTLTHRALLALEAAGIVKYVVSQNIDGLHLRSGFPRNRLSELHGNMFVEECNKCATQYVCSTAVPTIGLKPTGNLCTQSKSRGHCRGKLEDTILDWEDGLPERDIDMAEKHCKKSDLSLCLGTSLQIVPSGNLPLMTKKNKGRLALVNLQPTKHDKKADLKINTYVDDVIVGVCKLLHIQIPGFTKPMVLLKSIHTLQEETDLNVVVKDESLMCKCPYLALDFDRKNCQKKDVKGDNTNFKETSKTEVKGEDIKIEVKEDVLDCQSNSVNSAFEGNDKQINTTEVSHVSQEVTKSSCIATSMIDNKLNVDDSKLNTCIDVNRVVDEHKVGKTRPTGPSVQSVNIHTNDEEKTVDYSEHEQLTKNKCGTTDDLIQGAKDFSGVGETEKHLVYEHNNISVVELNPENANISQTCNFESSLKNMEQNQTDSTLKRISEHLDDAGVDVDPNVDSFKKIKSD